MDTREITWETSNSSDEITWTNLESRSKKRKFEVDDPEGESYDQAGKSHKKDTGKKAKADKTESKTILTPLPLDHTNGKETSSDLVYANDNHIYFNTSISTNTMCELQKLTQTVIDKIVDKKRQAEEYECEVKYPPIVLHINSPGGGIFAAFTYIDYMSRMRRKYRGLKFHSVVEGRAASAATLISVCADKRLITEYGYMLIHQLWSVTMGKYNEIKDDVSNLDSLMTRIKEIYRTHTNVPSKQIDEILKHDLYWDARTCRRHKLVDEILY